MEARGIRCAGMSLEPSSLSARSVRPARRAYTPACDVHCRSARRRTSADTQVAGCSGFRNGRVPATPRTTHDGSPRRHRLSTLRSAAPRPGEGVRRVRTGSARAAELRCAARGARRSSSGHDARRDGDHADDRCELRRVRWSRVPRHRGAVQGSVGTGFAGAPSARISLDSDSFTIPRAFPDPLETSVIGQGVDPGIGRRSGP